MSDSRTVAGLDPDAARVMARPRHPALFIGGIAVLTLWFPISFFGLVNDWGRLAPFMSITRPRLHLDVHLAVLLLWGVSGVPAVLLGYFGWHRHDTR